MLNKEIFKIAFPNIISNISIPLLGIVDTALMGRMEDTAYIGAIAIGGIVFNILYWGFGFLRPGTTGLTAQAFGKKNNKEVYALLLRALMIGVLISLILILFQSPIGDMAYSLLDGSIKVKELSRSYYDIRIWAAPAVLCLFAFRGWFFGVQNAIVPMVLTILVNVLNIILSWYFVMVKGLSVEGVALGTLISQWVTFFVALIIAIKRHKNILQYFKKDIFKSEELKRFLTVNRDMFLRNMGLILVFSFFTNHSSKLGDDYLAMNQILLELFYLMSYTVDGFAYASESLVGKYIGAKEFDTVKLIIKKCLIYGLCLSFFFVALYMFWGQELIGLFTNHQSLIVASKNYFILLSLVGVTGALAFVWDGVYSGATASVELRNSMLVAVISFFVVFKLTNNHFPLQAVWWGMIAFMISRSLMQMLLYNTSIKNRFKFHSNSI